MFVTVQLSACLPCGATSKSDQISCQDLECLDNHSADTNVKIACDQSSPVSSWHTICGSLHTAHYRNLADDFGW